MRSSPGASCQISAYQFTLRTVVGVYKGRARIGSWGGWEREKGGRQRWGSGSESRRVGVRK